MLTPFLGLEIRVFDKAIVRLRGHKIYAEGYFGPMSAKADNRTSKALEFIPGCKRSVDWHCQEAAAKRSKTMLVHFEKTEHGIILTLPNDLADHPAFASGDFVHLASKYSSLVITHPDATRYNIEEMVATITPENMHTEIDWGPPVGKEIW